MAAIDRDVRVGCLCLVFGLYICWTSFTMPMRGEFIESPGIFPGLMGILLLLFAVILLVQSLRKGGRLRLSRLFGSTAAILKSQEHRPILIGILLPAIYVFAGIPLMGFYLASVLFMTLMFYLYVKKWRKWGLFVPIALGITGILYLTFTVLFQSQIR